MRHRRVIESVPHFDYGLMAFSALSVVAVTLLACFVWISTGWQEGAGFVIMTAVGCSFFAAVDNPAPMIKSFVIWMSVAAVISAVYLFGILPKLQDFTMLVLVFAPPFLVAGTVIGRPQFMLIAMLLAVNIASLVGLQEVYSADFTTFANGNLASVAGGLFGPAGRRSPPRARVGGMPIPRVSPAGCLTGSGSSYRGSRRAFPRTWPPPTFWPSCVSA
jgi:uncharacterized membrane protein YccC